MTCFRRQSYARCDGEWLQIKISNIFAALETLYDSEGMNRVWKNIKDNNKSQLKRA
jgi:hypothetical protein